MSDVPPIFTLGALELILAMAGLEANLNRIRAALHKQEGVWFKDAEIIAAGKMSGFELVPVNKGSVPSEAIPIVPLPEKPKRVPDKVRLIPPGTFPAKGFTMLRSGRLYG